MASIQPVFSKIFEVKIGGRTRLSALLFTCLSTKYLFVQFIRNFELLEFLNVE